MRQNTDNSGGDDNDPNNHRFQNIGKYSASTAILLQLMADGYTYKEAMKKAQDDAARRQKQAAKEKQEKEK